MLDIKLDKNDMSKLMGIMHDCLYVSSNNDVMRIIDSLNDIIPFNAAILCKQESKINGPFLSEKINHSYPLEWVRSYFENNLFIDDPVIRASEKASKAFTWESAYRDEGAENDFNEFVSLANDYGLRKGVASLCNSCNGDGEKTLISLETNGNNIDEEYLSIVDYILPHIHESVVRVDEQKKSREKITGLTRRELETLKWAQEGKTAWEIGIILSISERTVKYHLNNIYQKLNVANRSQAIVKAMRHGLI